MVIAPPVRSAFRHACAGSTVLTSLGARMRNDMSGDADNVVQAQVVQGGIHVHHGKAASWPTPRQLPPDVSHFTGRAIELDRLDRLLESPADGQAPAIVISAIAGAGGMGKTTLAVHWAHRVRDQFPDGELYVNLQGFAAGPLVTPAQALEGFLRALGAPSDAIPDDVEGRAGLYRSMVAGRRMLVMLDNAAKADQVLPLLPGTPTCLVIVTSRSLLSGLMVRAGAQRMALDVLTPDESATLLRQIIGPDRVDEEPAAVIELAQCCAYLPLALRIAAERMAARPHVTVADVVEALAVEAERLDELAAEDDETAQVRAVFSWSYRALSPETARVFRMLSLHPGPTISVPAASALAGSDTRAMRRQLDDLAGVHLLEQTARDRFQFHDLVRVYAAERAVDEEDDEARWTALWRQFMWYLHSARAALAVSDPRFGELTFGPPPPGCNPLSFDSAHQTAEWCSLEVGNIQAVLEPILQSSSDGPVGSGLMAISAANLINAGVVLYSIDLALGEFDGAERDYIERLRTNEGEKELQSSIETHKMLGGLVRSLVERCEAELQSGRSENLRHLWEVLVHLDDWSPEVEQMKARLEAIDWDGS